LRSTGRTSREMRYPALFSDSTLAQYEVYKTLVWERGWGRGGKFPQTHSRSSRRRVIEREIPCWHA
jgi:hypothetical protein